MNYRLSSAAQTDLDDCWLYVAQDNPQAADRFKERLESVIRTVAGNGPTYDKLIDVILSAIYWVQEKMRTKNSMQVITLKGPITVTYREEGTEVYARALQFDLVGIGKTRKGALKELQEIFADYADWTFADSLPLFKGVFP